MRLEIPAAFDEFDEHALWGVSPHSLLLANNHTRTDSSQAEAALQRAHDIEVIRTNHDLNWNTYRDFLNSVCAEWFESPIGKAAFCADATTAKQFVAGAAYQTSGGVMRCLRQGVDQLRHSDNSNTVVVPARDLKAIAGTDSIRILRSLGVLRRTPQGYEYDISVLKSLHIGENFSRSEAAWALVQRLCKCLNIEADPISEALLTSADIPIPDERPVHSKASLPIYLTRTDLSEFVTDLFSENITTLIRELREDTETTRTQTLNALQFGISSDSVATTDWPLPEDAAIVCAIASQQDRPVVAEYLVDQLSDNQFRIHSKLRDAGIDVTLENGLLRFETAYTAPSTDERPVSKYRQWLTERIEHLKAREQSLDELVHRLSEGWSRQRQSLLEAIVRRLDGFRVSPTKFIFSMLDPNYLDDQQIEQYVGDSPLLEEEIQRIRTWRDEQPYDAETFSSAVSKVCHYPLENEDTEPILRIMSPWMNFSIQDYTATFRNLLDNDVTIQFLFRLPSQRGWNNLKQNLLTRLGDTQGNLELRTYTRFKEFHDHTELQEIQKSDENYVGETGIHAKMFIAGSPADGSLVAGSANLMENSFFYNPEAGLQTHDPNVLETAIDYFDLIWDLAEPDRIDESVFTSKTNFTFYPKVYRP